MRIKVVSTVARMPAVWRLRVLQQLARWGVREQTLLIVLAFVIGLAGGLSTWVFEKTVGTIERSYYLPLARRVTDPRWLFLLPLIPAAGGLMVSVVRRGFRVPHSKLHGISTILYALIREAGKLKKTMGVQTLISSSLTIGMGGSAGPEAPIAVIGASVGSLISDLAGISRRNLPTLIGCGAAAGIAAVFDAPIAGVLFAMEVLLRDFSVKTFTPIVISAVLAATTYGSLPGHNLHETRGLFELPAVVAGHAFVFSFNQLPFFLVLGILCGLMAVTLTLVLRKIEHGFWHLKRIHPFFHPGIGAFLSGVCGVVLIVVLWTCFRHEHFLHDRVREGYVPIFADGYPTIRRALNPDWYTMKLKILADGGASVEQLSVWFLLLACGLKVLATSFTLGGGGSGGVFAPSLFIGATGGGAVGIMLRHVWHGVEPSSFALVGMAAVLAAVIQAPLMAIILLFELTRDYAVMLPIMLAAVTATVIYQVMVGESIYSLPLKDQGIRLGSAVGVAALRRISVDQLTLSRAPVAHPNDSLAVILERSQQTGTSDYVVMDEQNRYLGLLSLDELRVVLLEPEAAPLLVVGEVLRSDVPPLRSTDTLEGALEAFARFEVQHLPVVDQLNSRQILHGMLSRGELMRRYHLELGD